MDARTVYLDPEPRLVPLNLTNGCTAQVKELTPHSPYRCQCFIRFLAEGGGPDTPDKHRPYLQGILLKRFDKH